MPDNVGEFDGDYSRVYAQTAADGNQRVCCFVGGSRYHGGNFSNAVRNLPTVQK